MSMKTQKGFSLVSAIFLIAIALLIVLAAALTMSARSRSTVQTLEASRALFAAHSGIDVAVARSLGGGCGAVPASITVEGFTVNLTCTPTQADEAPDVYNIFTLTAVASSGNFSSNTFVSRRVRATVTQ